MRRQFDEIPRLREKKAKPDYAYCVDTKAKKVLKGLLAPSLISVIVPLTVGFLLGGEAYAGSNLGNLASVLLLALVFVNSGTAWDNAKELIESEFVQRGGPTHAAAVIGDTVGDSFKDAVGPSLDILINIIGGNWSFVCFVVRCLRDFLHRAYFSISFIHNSISEIFSFSCLMLCLEL